MKKYVVLAIDIHTNIQVQESDPHTWAECEDVYQDYQEAYTDCRIAIDPIQEEV